MFQQAMFHARRAGGLVPRAIPLDLEWLSLRLRELGRTLVFADVVETKKGDMDSQ